MISLGRRNRTDSMGGLGEGGDGKRRGLVEKEMETVLGEMTRIGEYFEKKVATDKRKMFAPKHLRLSKLRGCIFSHVNNKIKNQTEALEIH